jgi:hypothetical protein
MTKFEDLYDFIDRATRSRKYPEATAHTLRAALKLYEPELNDEERGSVDEFEKNFEQITQSVFSKAKNRFSASSLATYRSRAQKVLQDFSQYSDPIKMNSWSPKVISRMKKKDSVASKEAGSSTESRSGVGARSNENIPENTHRIELALRPDAKFIVEVPRDLKATEADTIKAILTSLVTN